jgi:hypothetical protein
MNTRKANAPFPAALAGGLGLMLCALAPGAARADDKPRDPAAAEALYHRGRELVAAGNWDEGCAKFDASMELNPAVSTLINIAKCHEHQGKLTQALVDYRRALQLNKDTLGDERKKALEALGNEGIKAVEPRLARVEVQVKSRPEGLRVVRDGVDLPLGTLGETIPLDPGAHTFEAVAPGFTKDERRVTLAEGEHATVELELMPAPIVKAPQEKPAPVAKKGVAPPPPAPKREKGVPAWAFVSGGLGLVAVGAGVFFHFDQRDAEDKLVANCGKELLCDPAKPYDPQKDNERKNRDFALFVGLSAAGAVGIGAAIVGIAAASGSSKKSATQAMSFSPWFDRAGGGAVWRGAF